MNIVGVDEKFHGISTLIQISAQGIRGTGSGFFYEELGDAFPEYHNARIIEKTWVVTNRHVLLPKVGGKEFVPDEFTFNLRKKKMVKSYGILSLLVKMNY